MTVLAACTLLAPILPAARGAAGATLWGAGRGGNGALGPRGSTLVGLPVVVASQVAKAAAGSNHTVYLTRDGTLRGVGSNELGQLSLGAGWGSADMPETIATNVKDVSAGYFTTLYITSDGTLWGVGENRDGALGDGSGILRYKPVRIAADVVGMAGGLTHTLFITRDGTLWATGDNRAGQLGNGTTTSTRSAVAITRDVKAVACGASHSVYLKTDGSVWTMGDNIAGQLGDGSTTSRSAPVRIATDAIAVAAGAYFTSFITSDGSLWVCGDNPNGQLGTGNTSEVHTPVAVAANATAIAAGAYHLLVLKTDGTVWATGGNRSRQQGDNAPVDQRERLVSVATGMTAIVAGATHSLFLRADGTLLGVGRNEHGQLGGGTHAAGTAVPVATDVTAVAGGTSHTAYLTSDGSLWTLGYNDEGQLGDGTTRDRAEPKLVAQGVSSITTGAYTTYFIKSDGTLWSTGDNLRGQLGDGTTSDRSTPQHIANDVASVQASATSAVFLKSNRTLWGMGWNDLAELDASGVRDLALPVPIATSVRRMDVGQSVLFFITTDNVLHARGDLAAVGMLERGVARTPIAIMADVADVGVGLGHVLILKTDGTLWVVGNNRWGQLGVMQPSMSGVPMSPFRVTEPVQLTAGVSAIAAGANHSVFLRNDGTVWTMGGNADGQLGTGNQVDSPVPVQVASGVERIAAGAATSYWLQRTPPMISESPSHGPVDAPLVLSVTASGHTPLSYQWFMDGESLAGATTSTLNATAPGTYRVLVGGTIWSDPADVTVPNRLLNLSARAHVAAGVRTLIAGVSITGPSGRDKSVVLRAVGPTLGQFGVGNALPSPQHALYNAAGERLKSAYTFPIISENPDGPHELTLYPFDLNGLTAQIGAFPLLPTEADSLRPDRLAPGSYTFHVSAANGADGVALAEFYQVEDDGLPVTNFSARGWAGLGGDTLIAGFVVTGSRPATLLIRALGPTLGGLGVDGALPDPTLVVFDSTGKRVASATRWGDAPDLEELSRVTSVVHATPLPAGSADAALLFTASPGAYTVQVISPSGQTGVTLVEIYLAP